MSESDVRGLSESGVRRLASGAVIVVCQCGRKLRVPKARSAGTIRCPDCGASNDVQQDPASYEIGAGSNAHLFRDFAQRLRTALEQVPEGKPTLGRFRLQRMVKAALPEGRGFAADEERCAAIRALGESGDPRGLEPLRKIAASGDEPLKAREAAITALGATRNPRALPDLVEVLECPITSLHAAALGAIGAVGDRRSVRPLIYYGLEHPHHKYLSYDAVLKLGEGACLELLDVLNDNDPGVVLEAVVQLGRLKCAKAVPALVQIVETRSALFRSHAAEALGAIGDRKAVTTLVDLLSDANPGVRTNAAAALQKIPDPRAVGGLIEALDDEDEDVRMHAMQTLGEIADRRACDPLRKLLDDPNPEVRVTAAEAAGLCGDTEVTPALLDMAQSTDEATVLRALSALRRLKDRRATETLLDLLHHPSNAVRQRAVDALGPIGDADVAQRLEEVLRRDRADIVRFAAAKSLGEIRDPGSLDALLDALREDLSLRCRAIVSLGMIGDAAAVPALLAMLKDPAPEARFHAVGALAELAPPGAIAQLEPLIDDSSPMVRRGLAKAFEKLGDPRSEELSKDSVQSSVRRSVKHRRKQVVGALSSLLPSWLVGLWPATWKGQAAALGGIAALIFGIYVLASGVLPSFRGAGSGTAVLRGGPRSVAISPDGSQVGVARNRGLFELFEAGGPLRKQLRGDFKGCVFPGDGKTLILAETDGLVVWNFESEEAAGATALGHAKGITGAAVSSGRKSIATIDSTGVAVVWDLATVQPKTALQMPKGSSTTLIAVSADGTMLASVERKRGVSLWDVQAAALAMTLPSVAFDIQSLAFSPDGKTLAIGGLNNLSLVSLSREPAVSIPQVPAGVSCLTYSEDGKSLVFVSGWTVYVADVAAQTVKAIDVLESAGLESLSLSKDGRTAVACGQEDSAVWLVDLSQGKVIRGLDVD